MSEEIIKVDYTYQPAVIGFDFVGLETKVSEMVEPYMGLTESDVAGMDYKDAKARRTDLNRILKDVEAVRKAVKKQYNEPLAEFESRIREIELQITQPRDLIDGLVNEAHGITPTTVMKSVRDLLEIGRAPDEGDKRRRYDELHEHFLQFLEDNGVSELANSISFDALLDLKWLNRSVNEVKAKQLLDERLAAILADWQALGNAELFDRKHAEGVFLQTLDLRSAVQADAAKRDEADRLAAIHRQMDEAREQRQQMVDAAEADAAIEREREQAQAPQQASPCEEVYVWTIEIQCTEHDAKRAASLLKQMGLTGRIHRGRI